MTTQQETITIENQHTPPFFQKLPIAIERGEGVSVWDQNGKHYLDFTAGWGVTSIGHANPVITNALLEQSRKITQNPSSGLTYSPARAKLLQLLTTILPNNLTHIFFGSSGAEVNDAVMKLARKITGRIDIVSTLKSFHGRTISTASATGQTKHRERFNSLMPNYRFVPYDDLAAMDAVLDENIAAVMLEPIQGEGGINVPSPGYLEGVSALCRQRGALLIIDEIQTGFCRTGSMFAIDGQHIVVDFLTLGKGIAGGFPFAAFAMSSDMAARVEKGDHGGTYCGNPLGCAVAHAVISYLLEHDIAAHVAALGEEILARLRGWQRRYPAIITDARGKGLLLALEIRDAETASKIYTQALEDGVMLNLTQGNVIRIFPPLTITKDVADEGLAIVEQAFAKTLQG